MVPIQVRIAVFSGVAVYALWMLVNAVRNGQIPNSHIGGWSTQEGQPVSFWLRVSIALFFLFGLTFSVMRLIISSVENQ